MTTVYEELEVLAEYLMENGDLAFINKIKSRGMTEEKAREYLKRVEKFIEAEYK